MSRRSLHTIPLSNRAKRRLMDIGFKTVSDINEFDPVSLAKVIRRPMKDSNEIFRVLRQSTENVPGVKNLRDILADEFKDNKVQKIKTSCEALDKKLNGGIPIGNVIEIYGAAGCGKTQFCYQLCINVQIPSQSSGLDGSALYIDTESGVRTERLIELAEHFSHDVIQTDLQNSIKQIMDRIHLVFCHSPERLKWLILFHLDIFLDEHPEIRLVVLDSISYQLRYGCDKDYLSRTKMIILMANKLRMIAQKHSVAVVITNQITSNIDLERIIPALGKTWSYTSSTKIFLEREDGVRSATLVKSRLKGHFKTFYAIESKGITEISPVLETKTLDSFEKSPERICQ